MTPREIELEARARAKTIVHQERNHQRQIGYDAEHDDAHALDLQIQATQALMRDLWAPRYDGDDWGIAEKYSRPGVEPDRQRFLRICTALLLAELEREIRSELRAEASADVRKCPQVSADVPKCADAGEAEPERETPEQLNERMLRWFEYAHLPPPMQAVSRMFGELAYELVGLVPRTPERTVALRKLLEAKDAAVRAQIESEVRP